MARPRRRRPNKTSPTPASTRSNESVLEILRRHAMRNQDARSPASAMPQKAAPKSESMLPLSVVWHEDLQAIWFSMPDPKNFDETDFHFGIGNLYQHGEFHGYCQHGGQTFPIAVLIRDADDGKPVIRCGCGKPGNNHFCDASIHFVPYLMAELRRNGSPLKSRVDFRRFTQGQPSYEDFDRDLSARAIGRLDTLVQSLGSADDDSPFDVLDSGETESGARLAWRLEVGDSMMLRPLIQQPKKRGGGFTKGKLLSIESVMTRINATVTPQDRDVIALIERREGYYSYRAEFELDPLPALQALVGAPNVFIDATPVTIAVDSIIFVPGSNGQEVVLRPELFSQMFPWIANIARTGKPGDAFQQTSGPRRIVMGKTGPAAILDLGVHRVSVLPVTDRERSIFQALIKLEPVRPERSIDLFERLQTLREHASITLTVEKYGEFALDRLRPVVVLRSTPDGTLEFAFRARDAAGRLRIPGRSPAVIAVTRDQQPIQAIRNLAAEQDFFESFLKQTGIPNHPSATDPYRGSVVDFDDAMRLIVTLQDAAHVTDAFADAPPAVAADHPAPMEVLWDRTGDKPIEVLGTISSSNVRVDIQRKRDWFGISGSVRFGEQEIALESILDQIGNIGDATVRGDFVQLKDGQWARIEEKLRKRLRTLRDAANADRGVMKLDATSAPAIRDALADSGMNVNAVAAWQECLDRLHRAENLNPVVPESLDAELRDYQVEGFKWLRRLAEWGVGGILADDMGLGKTVQTLAVLLDRQSDGPSLVIAPTSVGFNWHRETERFAPDLCPHLYRETDRQRLLSEVGPGDLVICSYGLALRDAEALAKVNWGSMVLDEAQAIKNGRSKTSRAIASIPSKWTVALTGTPVENHLGELWSLFRVISPGVFGGWDQFRQRFAAPIEKQNDEPTRKALANRLRPFVLRRTKDAVLKELPPRTEMNLLVDLSKPEREAYELVRREAIGEIDSLDPAAQTQDQRFRILAMLTRLRQISCHAGLVQKDYSGTSAKLTQLLETLAELKDEGHRALIFSQFVEHLSLIRAALDENGFTYEYLDGSTPPKTRQERVDAFQNGTADAFLISLKAGGTGLNLTAADYVIHMDPWWNPAVEDQATDRAHRMGQDKPVMVYRIIARGTVEEEILALHETKRDLVAGVLEGASGAAKLSNDELIAMLRGEL